MDENGEPRVVYHQTNSTIFVNKETGENFDDLSWKEKDFWRNEASKEEWNNTWEERDFYSFDNKTHGRRSVEMPAFFFSPVYEEYHEYGERTIEAFLNIRNPIFNPDIPNRGVTDTAGEDAMNALIEQGYDGFIRKYEGVVEEINAFYPNQIKSATENEGTFGINNNDIRKSLRKDFVNPKVKEEHFSDEDDNNNDTSVGELLTRYSVRKKRAPQKTIKAYKLFKVDVNGNPHTLFIDKASNLEQGIWYDADCPNIESIKNLDAGYI